jgi:predicted amidohydrolase YtcJ
VTADIVLSGRIATLAGESGLGWVEAIAIRDGRVVAAGSAAEVEPNVGPATRRIALEPAEVAIPGLTDAHLHLAETALNADRVDLSDASTLDEALARIRAAHESLNPGAWLEGHGWGPDRWGRWPHAADLEHVAAGRRVALWAYDHHSLWASRAALEAAGIDDGTPDPDGGLIRRDDDGTTGILHESASRLVTRQIPPVTADDLERAIPALGATLLSLGVVAVHDPGSLSLQSGLGPAFEAYRRLADAGRLPVRVHPCIREEQLAAAIDASLRSGDPIGGAEPGGASVGVRFGWLKLFADGTLSSRTAALLDPIEPEPDRPLPPGTERGVWMTPPDRLAELAARAADAGIATAIHAIGDHAVRAALDALEPTAGRARLAPRLEHIQLIHPDDTARFGRAGIVASVQPVHLRTDAEPARRLWGARAERSGYAWGSLLRSGAVLAFGTDAPVEPIDPWPGLAMAATRTHPSWPAPATFGSTEVLSLDQVLRAACIGPPSSAGETDRGRLVPGSAADVVVIGADAVAEPVVPGGALESARPRLVLRDGHVAYEA